MGSALSQLGTTQQRLLRQLLMTQDGSTVEALCERLHISHNAVRQHLSALIGRDCVERTQSRPSGGRPQARFRLTDAGRALFPRNYGVISAALLARMAQQLGEAELGHLLRDMGTELGRNETPPPATASNKDVAHALAQRLDALGYEAVPALHGQDWQIEAFNCVFHALARQTPKICEFDLAYMEAASGRRIHHMECIVRGGGLCRFRIDAAAKPDK